MYCTRNEQFQEELWRISCDLLKDWMSPEIRSKYSTTTTEDQPPPAAATGNDGNTSADDKSAENNQ